MKALLLSLVLSFPGQTTYQPSIVNRPPPCNAPVESVIIFDGGGATPCPVTALALRRSVTLCNSPKNSGSPVWTVRNDGADPTTALSSPGQALGKGDCIAYVIETGADGGNPLHCISDTAGAALTTTECK